MKKIRWFTVSILFCVILIFAGVYFWSHRPSQNQNTFHPPRPINVTYSAGHYFVAGFQIDSLASVQNAASLGVQQNFMYSDVHPVDSEMGKALKAAHIQQVGAKISYYLYVYECHRLFENGIDRQGFCSQDYPQWTHQHMLDMVKAEILQTRANVDHAGYWILDDWPASDEGSAKQILREITSMVHELDPGKITVCGFGAELGVKHTDNFHAGVVKNYSPGGCDMIGIYIYSESVTDPNTSPTTFDWSMSTLLPKIFSSLQDQGWDATKVPFMGIGQAWAGTRTDVSGLYEIVPRAQDIALQSASFCKSGALGINFYAWNTGSISGLQTPANNEQIKAGVMSGVQACKKYWATVQPSTPSVTPSATRSTMPFAPIDLLALCIFLHLPALMTRQRKRVMTHTGSRG